MINKVKYLYYTKLLKNKLSTELYIAIDNLYRNNDVLKIQTALRKLGFKLKLDNIFGKNTYNAIINADKNKLYKILKSINKKGYKHNNIMQYLAREEGTVIHWNKGEKSYTSPYGVYKYAHPTAEVILYIDSLFKKYNLIENRRNAKKLNKLLTEKELKNIYNLAYEFYKNNYLNNKLYTILKDKKFYKSYITLFSISVNGGKRRGYKAIQSALKVRTDGIIGEITINKLNRFNKSDDIFNIRMIEYMKRFYQRLIEYNPSKYKRFRRGWMNRLKRLV